MSFRIVAKLIVSIPIFISLLLWIWSAIELVKFDTYKRYSLASPSQKHVRFESEYGYWSVEAGGIGRAGWVWQKRYTSLTRLSDRVWCSWPYIRRGSALGGFYIVVLVPHWITFLISCITIFIWWFLRFRNRREVATA